MHECRRNIEVGMGWGPVFTPHPNLSVSNTENNVVLRYRVTNISVWQAPVSSQRKRQ